MLSANVCIILGLYRDSQGWVQSTPVHQDLDLKHLHIWKHKQSTKNHCYMDNWLSWATSSVPAEDLQIVSKLDRNKGNTGLIRVHCQINQVLWCFKCTKTFFLGKIYLEHWISQPKMEESGSEGRMPVFLPDSWPLTWTKWRFVLIPNAFLTCTFLQKENMLGNSVLCKTYTHHN